MRTPKCLQGVLVSAMIASALLPSAARAADLGAIVGRLTNAAGAPVANATVTAQRVDGSAIRATISGSDGVYSFADLPPGTWSVKAQSDGYPEMTAPSLVVVAGKATRTDLVMNVPAPPAGPAVR